MTLRVGLGQRVSIDNGVHSILLWLLGLLMANGLRDTFAKSHTGTDAAAVVAGMLVLLLVPLKFEVAQDEFFSCQEIAR